MTDKLSKQELKHGSYYKGKSEFGTVARWNDISKCFRMWQIKGGKKYLVNVKHPDDEKAYKTFSAAAECSAEEYIPLGSIISNRFLRKPTIHRWIHERL